MSGFNIEKFNSEKLVNLSPNSLFYRNFRVLKIWFIILLFSALFTSFFFFFSHFKLKQKSQDLKLLEQKLAKITNKYNNTLNKLDVSTKISLNIFKISNDVEQQYLFIDLLKFIANQFSDITYLTEFNYTKNKLIIVGITKNDNLEKILVELNNNFHFDIEVIKQDFLVDLALINYQLAISSKN